MKLSRSLSLLSILAVTFTGCNLFNSDADAYKAVYRRMQTPDNQTVALGTLKDELSARLAKVPNSTSTVSIDGDKLVAIIHGTDLTVAKAVNFGATTQITLQEHRTTYTAEEQNQIDAYNAEQKVLLQKAHSLVLDSNQNFDDVVAQYSEKSSFLNKGIEGPKTAGFIPETAFVDALNQTAVGAVTKVVELPYGVWFAKVIEKSTNNNQTLFTYQEVIRHLKETSPRLDSVPVANLSHQITNATVTKKDPASKSIKDYLITINLTDEGARTLAALQQKDSELTLFIDRIPYTKLTLKSALQGSSLVLDNQYTEKNAQDIVNFLNQGSLSAGLTLLEWTPPEKPQS
jgi:preprotein translocase subunit SecD